MTKTRNTILTIWIGVAVAIGFLFYSKKTLQEASFTHKFQNSQGIYLEIPNTHWVQHFFRDLEKRTKRVGLPNLREIVLPDDDLEVHFWIYRLQDINGLILKRTGGKWSASYLHDLPDHQLSSLKLESLEEPKYGWQDLWDRLVDAGVLTLADQSSKWKCTTDTLDGISYIVETNVDQQYRTFSYGDPRYTKCDEAQQFLQIAKVLWKGFNLQRFQQ